MIGLESRISLWKHYSMALCSRVRNCLPPNWVACCFKSDWLVRFLCKYKICKFNRNFKYVLKEIIMEIKTHLRVHTCALLVPFEGSLWYTGVGLRTSARFCSFTSSFNFQTLLRLRTRVPSINDAYTLQLPPQQNHLFATNCAFQCIKSFHCFFLDTKFISVVVCNRLPKVLHSSQRGTLPFEKPSLVIANYCG